MTRRAARMACMSSMPKPLARAFVEAHLVGQALAVEAPALGIGDARQARAEAAQVVQLLELALDADLEVVARAPPRGRSSVASWWIGRDCGLVGVDEVDARSRAVRRRREVEGRRRLRRRVGLDRPDLAGRLGQAPEPARSDRRGVLDLAARELDEVVRVGHEVRRVAVRGRRAARRRRRGRASRAMASRSRSIASSCSRPYSWSSSAVSGSVVEARMAVA